ncbi:MAG: cytochrome c oxidase accessory protein CcoG [Phycisphaeraceae bacterium]|nr:cytochrome c oxidase accessory protein CcoG [Phycisphaeraceae bacterium]
MSEQAIDGLRSSKPATSAADAAAQAAADEAASILSTLNADGSRRWIRPRPSRGRYLQARRWVAYSLIAIFTLIPYLRFNGKPLVLLDIAARRFTLFGYTFLPTDTLLLALLAIGIFASIFLFTALFGRVWCGWACPQTVYMEFVYRPLERLCRGTPGRAKKGPLQTSALGVFVMYGAYLLVSMFLAHTFLAYFVGVDQLRVWVTRSPAEHPVPFGVMAFVTAAMMFDFAFFREQTCLVACPYGRFQSVMLDRNSLIVAYDTERGEPRGRRSTKHGTADLSLPVLGDCVDCGLCVATCPTGIDIRRGLQMECVHCTQCIDACDGVMSKIHKPAGLIRYASQAELVGERRSTLRPRLFIYSTVIAATFGLFAFLVATKSPFDVMILRQRGLPYQVSADGLVTNNVKVKLVNREDRPQRIRLDVLFPEGGSVLGIQNELPLEPGQMQTLDAVLAAPRSAFSSPNLQAELLVTSIDDSGRESTRRVRYPLVGPATTRSNGAQP